MLRRNPGGAAELSTGECSARRKGPASGALASVRGVRAPAGAAGGRLWRPGGPRRRDAARSRRIGRRADRGDCPGRGPEGGARGGTTGSPTLLQLDGGSRFLELGLQLVGLVLGE